MLKTRNQSPITETLSLPRSEGDLLRSNIPAYSLVGFACATSADNAVTLTIALVSAPPYPESRPIRVLMSRDACHDLAFALERLAHLTNVPAAVTGAGRHLDQPSQGPRTSADRKIRPAAYSENSRFQGRPERVRKSSRLINAARPALSFLASSFSTGSFRRTATRLAAPASLSR
jgi:hypothetical protein